MLQAIVARMAGNEAALKNWCITLTTAVCGFAISLQRPLVALLALLPIAVFAMLDAQYLRIERRFRALFDRVRSEDWATVPSFEIDLSKAPPRLILTSCEVGRSAASTHRSRSPSRSWRSLRGASDEH